MEVFLDGCFWRIGFLSLLHVRGGVSGEAMVGFAFLRSSPRPWRCFLDDSERRKRKCVFSTSVEVFPRAIRGCRRRTCLLHVRGGVSIPLSVALRPSMSSPRPWRCFHQQLLNQFSIVVFSTSVEVFPEANKHFLYSFSLLHVRGGVSEATKVTQWPRSVFSTSVEVFLKNINKDTELKGLLHVRGGVS